MLLSGALAQQLVQPVFGISLKQVLIHLGHLVMQTLQTPARHRTTQHFMVFEDRVQNTR